MVCFFSTWFVFCFIGLYASWGASPGADVPPIGRVYSEGGPRPFRGDHGNGNNAMMHNATNAGGLGHGGGPFRGPPRGAGGPGGAGGDGGSSKPEVPFEEKRTLRVASVPAHLLKMSKLSSYFARFGDVVNIKVAGLSIFSH